MQSDQFPDSTPIISDLNPPKVIEHTTTFSPLGLDESLTTNETTNEQTSERTMDTQMLESIYDDKPRFNRGFVFGCATVAALIVGFFYMALGNDTSSMDNSAEEVIVEPEIIADVPSEPELIQPPKALLNDGSVADLAFAGREQAKHEEQAAPVAMPVSATKAQFAYDSSRLTGDAKIGLKSLVARLKADKTMKYRIEGHADERGTHRYNYRLGLRRANAVKTFLVQNGISAKRLTVVSFGESRPLAAGKGKYAPNRRVEWRTAATLLTER